MSISIKTSEGKFVAVPAKVGGQIARAAKLVAKLSGLLTELDELGAKPRRRRRKNKKTRKARKARKTSRAKK